MRHSLRSTFAGRTRRTSLILAAVSVALAVAIPSAASAAAFTAHLKAPNHTPIANKKWPITVTATKGRTKLSGSVSYRFLFDGQVVGSRPGRSFKNGVCHDTLLFPGEAEGHAITLQVVVKTRYGTDYINWAVTTKK
jgi:hypothetical protein